MGGSVSLIHAPVPAEAPPERAPHCYPPPVFVTLSPTTFTRLVRQRERNRQSSYAFATCPCSGGGRQESRASGGPAHGRLVQVFAPLPASAVAGLKVLNSYHRPG